MLIFRGVYQLNFFVLPRSMYCGSENAGGRPTERRTQGMRKEGGNGLVHSPRKGFED